MLDYKSIHIYHDKNIRHCDKCNNYDSKERKYLCGDCYSLDGKTNNI